MLKFIGTVAVLLGGWFLLGSCSNGAYNQNVNESLRLGTASQEGHYYGLGESMSSLFNDSQDGVPLDVIATNGSVDNIEKLSSGELDLAIVQNDIAFFAENGLAPFNREIEDLRGIISFYSEPIYVVTNDPSIDYLYQLRDRRINVGPEGSGLFIDVRIILNSVDLWSVITRDNKLPLDGVDAVLNGDVDAAFTNAILSRHKEAIADGTLKLIPIRSSTISMISNTYPYFERFDTNQFQDNVTTISVRAMLITRDGLDNQLINELTRVLHENYLDLSFPVAHNTDVAGQVMSSMSLRSFHDGAVSYYEEAGIIKSQDVLRIVGVVSVAFLIFFISVLAIQVTSGKAKNSLLGNKIRAINPIQRSYKFIVRHRYLMVLMFMISAYASIIILVQSFEHRWAIQNNAVSYFNNRSFGSNLLWMFVFGGSGYIDNLFPNSPVSKFLVALIRLIGIGGFLAIVGLFTSDQIKNRILKAKGEKKAMIKDHIILCGWNENVPFLINNLLHEDKVNKKPIVLLADPVVEKPLEHFRIDYDMVTFVRGSATKKTDLNRAGMQSADIAVIIADAASEEPDAKSILKILTIEKYCRELETDGKRGGRENIYTIAEIVDTDNFEAAHDADVDEIISLGHIKSKIVVQSILNPGVSNFINETLTYNEFNEYYTIPIEKNSSLAGKTFDELLISLRKHKILLLSISIGNHKSRKEKADIQSAFKLSRTVLTNPFKDEEINYKTQEDDVLVVLAESEKALESVNK